MGVKHGILVLAETFLLILFVPTSNYLSRLLHLLACGMEPLSAFNFSEQVFSVQHSFWLSFILISIFLLLPV
jgi:hypothetical protein